MALYNLNETSLFLASIIVAIISSILGGIFANLVIHYDHYRMLIQQAIDEKDEVAQKKYENLKNRLNVPLLAVAILLTVLMITLLIAFTILSSVSQTSSISADSTCKSENITYIVYNYNITLVNVINKNQPLSIEELKNLVQKKTIAI